MLVSDMITKAFFLLFSLQNLFVITNMWNASTLFYLRHPRKPILA